MQRRIVVERADRSARTCEGKLAFDYAGARRAIRRMKRQGHRGMAAFWCNQCAAYHLGGQEWAPRRIILYKRIKTPMAGMAALAADWHLAGQEGSDLDADEAVPA